MNQVHHELPTLEGEYFVYRLPHWLMHLLRAFSGIAGITTALIAIRHWGNMPVQFQALTCLLVPAFFYFAATRQNGSRHVRLLADEQGMFFPGEDKWLFVPWTNISKIRVVKIMDGNASTGVAFNLQLSPQEEFEFFRNHLKPADQLNSRGLLLAVGYVNWPPSPKKLAEILLGLKNRNRQESQIPATLADA
jgi:hypothetical protein